MKSPVFSFALALLLSAAAHAGNDAVVTSVFSSISNGYQRKKLPDGSFQREYYALANGIYTPGTDENASINKSQFPQISALVTQQLAKQNYFMAEDAKSAEILLMISWGTTTPYDDTANRNSLDRTLSAMNATNQALRREAETAHPQTRQEDVTAENGSIRAAAQDVQEGQLIELGAYNTARRQADEYNARLLGYTDEINNRDNPARLAGGGSYFDDLISDIEEERYYIVVSAYDFRTAVKDGKRKLLWATRISIRSQGNRFDERLGTMLASASGYFGRGSKQLIRQYQEGKVSIGDMKVVGTGPEATPPEKTPEAK